MLSKLQHFGKFLCNTDIKKEKQDKYALVSLHIICNCTQGKCNVHEMSNFSRLLCALRVLFIHAKLNIQCII